MRCNSERGSVELIVLGLLAALIGVLAFPMLSSIWNMDNQTKEIVPQKTQQVASVTIPS